MNFPEDLYIHTQAGRFYPAKPVWNIEAAAHSLAQTARYGGNCDEQYSVAEHSVLVAGLMNALNLGNPLEGLLHDLSEHVSTDVVSPYKPHLPDMVAMQTYFDRSWRAQYALPLEQTLGCHRADQIALFIETAQLLPERGADFPDPLDVRKVALELREKGGLALRCFSWRAAKAAFLDSYMSIITHA